MTQVKFGNQEPTKQAASTGSTATGSQVPAKQETQLPATQSGSVQGDYVQTKSTGDYLTLIAKTSELAKEFPVGNFVLDKSIDLGDNFTIIFLRIKFSYEEKVPFEDDREAQTFAAFAAAKESGLDINAVGDMDILIELGKDDPSSEYAIFSDGDFHYIPAKYTVRSRLYFNDDGTVGTSKKTAYGATADIVMDDMKRRFLNGIMHAGKYTISSVDYKKTVGKKTTEWVAPKLKAAGKISDSLLKIIKENLGL